MVLYLVADIGADALDHLGDEFFGLELKDLVGDVHPVDEVVIPVESGG